jgi:Holliday junction DNA helicase RuvB
MSRKPEHSSPGTEEEDFSSPEPNSDIRTGEFLDATLRPSTWDEYVGQESIKNNLHILISAARERQQPPEHILFYGPPGLGKTTLAHLIAREQGANLRTTSGPAIERVGDLAALLTNLQPAFL